MGQKQEYIIALTKFQNWFENVAATALIVLHDKEGFGEKRLNRFFDNWTTLWNDVKDNCLSCEDIKKTLKTECNIDIKKMI